jgi:predicted ATPase
MIRVAMRDPPSGTVTFLFTDVEGSTRLLQELGPARYAEALDEHRRMLRGAFGRHGGVEVDTQGDAFFVAFPSASGAVAAAEDVQTELAAGPIRVRMGLHTGRPHLGQEGYVGEAVHLGARIAAVGHAGQVLLSKATRELVEADVADLGEHRLKDFDQPVWIFQLGADGFPPLKTISNTNLPRPASSFVGREREVGEVVSLVREGARLVTLSGPGGSGKTRLAIEAAVELVPEFKAGVFWVGLAPLRDAALVTGTIARTLGAADEVAGHVAERELLLLLDNFEQVVEAAPEVSTLLSACPNLTVLVTSRELLRIQGEVEYAVPPLAEPEAVELFSARSQLPSSPEIGELCARLDNLPLAVELAAARTSVLSPSQILERLTQRLDLLRGGRDADARQQTLRATIQWSYDLLAPEEQRLFARLAVFAGGCTLEAAEEVASADLDTLQSLVEKSLVRHSGERFWMLETIREFARGQLEQLGEADAIRRRHVDFFLSLAEAADLTDDVPSAEQLEPVRAETDNVRAALEWSLENEPELGLRLAVALEGLWVVSAPIEGMRWYDSLLQQVPDAPLELRASALRAYGGAANPAGRDDLAERLYTESLDAFRALGDVAAGARLLLRLGYAAFYRQDTERARSLGEESLTTFSASGDRRSESLSLGLLGEVEYAEGNREAGLELMEQSADLAGKTGFAWWRAGMLGKLSDCQLEQERLDQAEACAGEALALSRDLGDRLRTVRGLARLARIAAERGEPERAGRLWGAVEAEEARGPIGAWENERDRFERPVLAHAGPELEGGRGEGRRLRLNEAVDSALAPIGR